VRTAQDQHKSGAQPHGNDKHGRFTIEAIESRRGLNALIRMLKEAATFLSTLVDTT